MKTLLLIMILTASAFAANFMEELDGILTNNTDTIISLYTTTDWRSELDYGSYEAAKDKVPSSMIWAFNIKTGKGTMLDNTPDMTSLYDILNFQMNRVTIHDGSVQLVITALIQSDAGNFYGVIINDMQKQMSFSGPECPKSITREYQAESVFIGTALELKLKLLSNK